MSKRIPLGISNHHVHLSQFDLETLFGHGYELTSIKDLSQPGQFACEETVTVATYKGVLGGVRVLGPVRKQTQVEISLTDSYKLGVKVPIRDSGNLEDSPGLVIIGPEGSVALSAGVIGALRHVHMTPEDAAEFGVKDGDFISLRACGERMLTFHRVLVRVSERFALEVHLDTDEANAAGLRNGDELLVIAGPEEC